MRNKLYTERIELCVSKSQKEALVKLSKKYDLTLNQLIREAIYNQFVIKKD